MKKLLIITAIIALTMTAQAQDKKFDKIMQLYDSENYTECMEAVKKYNAANPSKPDGVFLLAFTYHKIFRQAPQKEYNLTSAENTLYNAFNKDKDKTVRLKYKTEVDELKATITEFQDKFYAANDNKKAGQHAMMLAKIFNDTTETYKHIFMPELFAAPVTYGKTLAAYEGPTNQTDVTGKKIGVWIELYPNGNRKSQINYEGGKPRGDFYKFYEHGGVSAHLYMIDDDRASAILYDENGDRVAMGYYYQRQKDSLWQYLESDSILVAEENYIRGKKNGLETTYFPYGLPAEELNWKDGVKNGVWKRYHDIGTILFEANYVNGKLEGRYTKYNSKGEIELIGNYKNDVKHGEWKELDPKTKKFKVTKYIDGEPENAAEEALKESKEIDKQSEEGKYLPDPVDFHNNPEEFFQRQ